MKSSDENFMFLNDQELDNLLASIAYCYERDLPGLKTGRQAFVVSEVVTRTKYSLEKKYPTHTNGYNADKIAGAYAFWIAKLKPLYIIGGGHVLLNEVSAIAVGFAVLKMLLGRDVALTSKRTTDLLNMLRYHTTSPHTLTSLFACYA